jgi:hypothetical protein
MKDKHIKEKEKKYWNVALSKNTYSLLLKRGVKNESFDQIVAKILKKNSEGQLNGLEPS